MHINILQHSVLKYAQRCLVKTLPGNSKGQNFAKEYITSQLLSLKDNDCKYFSWSCVPTFRMLALTYL